MSQWTIRTVERGDGFNPLELVRMLHDVVGTRALRKRDNQLTLMIDVQFESSFAHQHHGTGYWWIRW